MFDSKALAIYGVAVAGLVALVATVLALTDMPWPADLGIALAALMVWPAIQLQHQGSGNAED